LLTPVNAIMRETDLAFAAKVLHGRVEVFAARLSKVVSTVRDKTVHDTRVESRRLCAALEAFRALFPPNPFSFVHGEVRQITRLLGKPRETAVSLDLMRTLADKKKIEPSCRRFLEGRLNSKLQKQVVRLQKKIQRIDPLRILSRLDFLLSVMAPDAADSAQRLGVQPNLPLDLFGGPQSAIFQAAPILKSATSPILEYGVKSLFDAAEDEELHSLRISAKKARYAMEIYSPIWPGGLEECISIARKFQDAAGMYHDWGVFGQYLAKEIRRLQLRESYSLLAGTGQVAADAVSCQKSLKPIMRGTLLELQDRLEILNRTIRLLATHSDLHTLKHAPSVGTDKRKKRQKAASGSTANKASVSH
jgi:CHAD domain-containing protein